MKKSDKKTENTIRESLTEVCEMALENVSGFKWLTHCVNYNNFPDSLSIVCVFQSNDELLLARKNHMDNYLYKIIRETLERSDIKIPDIKKRILFDTEENCLIENNGNWNERLN